MSYHGCLTFSLSSQEKAERQRRIEANEWVSDECGMRVVNDECGSGAVRVVSDECGSGAVRVA